MNAQYSYGCGPVLHDYHNSFKHATDCMFSRVSIISTSANYIHHNMSS